jgi:hypothetical protein
MLQDSRKKSGINKLNGGSTVLLRKSWIGSQPVLAIHPMIPMAIPFRPDAAIWFLMVGFP